MRRVFVVLVLVFGALTPPLLGAPPAGAAAAGACSGSGVEVYPTPLFVTTPPATMPVWINWTLSCISVPGLSFAFTAMGTMTGTCAAEVGTATITTTGYSGTMAWTRGGFHDFFVVNFWNGGTNYVWTAPTAWTPPGVLDCVSPGVTAATLNAFGPLAGV